MYFKLCLGSSGGTDLSRRMYSGSITVYSVWGVIVIGSITVRTVTLGHFSKIGFLKLAFFEQLFHGYLHNQGVAAINANCIYNLLLVSFYIYTQMQKERYISSV